MDRLIPEIPIQNLKDIQALLESTPDRGNICELGVYKGGSARYLYEKRGARTLHLFDTFTGIPEATPELDSFAVGAFRDTDLPLIQSLLTEAVFHVGFFPETLPSDLNEITFVHIDCDQYATCKKAIEEFWPRMISGSIMAFDDYGFRGIKRAIDETITDQNIMFTEHGVPWLFGGVGKIDLEKESK